MKRNCLSVRAIRRDIFNCTNNYSIMEKSEEPNPNPDILDMILCDTDADDSVKQDDDGGDKLGRRSGVAMGNPRKSLFNITFDDFYENEEEKKHESLELKEFEDKLNNELRGWKNVLHDAYNVYKKSGEEHPTIDKSILPPDRREYLENAPCLNSFVRDSMEFREQALIFLQIDYEETMEALANLESLCRHSITSKKATLLWENLGNYKK